MLELKHIYFAYDIGSPYVLKDINLQVHDGDYISVVGENGSGKSTLMKILLALVEPTSGTVENSFSRISYVPQRFEALNSQFPITVGEVMHYYRKILKLKDASLAQKYLHQVGMEKYTNRLIGNLSGGQCQKVFIAKALMAQPDLLILDEPSVGIDVRSQTEMYDLLHRLNQEGMTIITVEHNLRAAERNSKYMFHITDGMGHLCSPCDYVKEYVSANTGSESYV